MQLKNIKNEINEIEKKLINIKNNEINRIFKNFIQNDYERKHNVLIDDVLTCLIGEYNKNSIIQKYYKLEKEYINNFKQIQFYNKSRQINNNNNKLNRNYSSYL